MKLRQATKSDLEQVFAWTLKIHQHEDDGSLNVHPEFETHLKAWIEEELGNRQCLYLLAETDDQQGLGFIGSHTVINDNGLLKDPLKGVIHLLWVDADYRNNGLAQTLVARVEDCFRELGVGYIECSYTACNQIGERFWAANGFQPVTITARKFI